MKQRSGVAHTPSSLTGVSLQGRICSYSGLVTPITQETTARQLAAHGSQRGACQPHAGLQRRAPLTVGRWRRQEADGVRVFIVALVKRNTQGLELASWNHFSKLWGAGAILAACTCSRVIRVLARNGSSE